MKSFTTELRNKSYWGIGFLRVDEIEKTIAELTNSTKTSIQVEYAPSDDEEEFDNDIEMWRNMNEEKRKTIRTYR